MMEQLAPYLIIGGAFLVVFAGLAMTADEKRIRVDPTESERWYNERKDAEQ